MGYADLERKIREKTAKVGSSVSAMSDYHFSGRLLELGFPQLASMSMRRRSRSSMRARVTSAISRRTGFGSGSPPGVSRQPLIWADFASLTRS